ncbi:baseplate J/gp47 family protein [uncultured Chitinophaga sp.]|jgi:Baseplate J-like protein.|uniref:baseplate J/gp47 family protein n=1 Tax=uncultured Chitinophaga sp. TaxID=339340 RepID=UPI00260DDE76|nr:baseplate J/gp47 family protein [uncultured Chitinophaga sp.]
MSNTDNIANTLIRDGASQQQRMAVVAENAVLSAGYVKLDERSTADLLSLLYRYARFVLYYDERDYAGQTAGSQLLPTGDWQAFFRNNAPFQYAFIQQFDTAALESSYNSTRARQDKQFAESGHWPLVNSILAVAIQVNSWYTTLHALQQETALRRMLKALIQNDLSKALQQLIAVGNTFNAVDELPYTAELLQLAGQEEDIWGIRSPMVRLAKDAYLAKLAPYPRRQRQQTLVQLDELFQLFFKGVQQVQQFALSNFEETLTGNDQEHAPYQGLLYAFLEIFKKVKDGRNGLNDITRLHLDFFYKEILQLKHRPHVPDHVHVVTTLAKQVETFLQAKDTALKAGKDASGKEIIFLTEEDVVLNKATVAEMRTLSKDNFSTLYAAPKANSADGLGSAFQDPANNSWPVLGAASWISKNNPAAGPQHYPFALSGFMLSSAVLLMKEGTRKITANITLQNLDADATALNSVLKDLLRVQYTSDKGWTTVADPAITYNNGTLSIVISLLPDAPPVLRPDEKKLLIAYPVTAPMLRILFNQQKQSALKTSRWYDLLSHAVISGADINVEASGLKQVQLSNDDGPIDPNKAFAPFSSIPKTESSFYLGSDEAFRKHLTSMTLAVKWEGLPANFTEHYKGYNPNPPINNTSFTVKVEKLENGHWKDMPAGMNALPLFQQSGTTLAADNSFQLDVSTLPMLEQETALAPYSNASLYGFVRFKLNRHFYHQEYPAILAMQTLRLSDPKIAENWSKVQQAVYRGDPAPPLRGLWQQAGDSYNAAWQADDKADHLNATPSEEDLTDLRLKTQDTVDKSNSVISKSGEIYNLIFPVEVVPNADLIAIPKQPYTPSIRSFSLSYTADAGVNDIVLLHQYPYEESNYKPVPTTTSSLMPVFDDEGALYLGIKDAVPGANLSLLFQLAAFSADPDIPAANVYWQYLSGNEWKPLAKDTDVISDTTQSLLTSGIVTIALPWDADLQHTILPSGLHWLRVAAASHTTAVCEAIVIAAQGARAVFSNQDNGLTRLSTALPAQRISALAVPQSAVKSVVQDFPSFGGRTAETDAQFYVRISERLRHKGRAINIYDYERLVLDAFPDIYKVKCIPHTKICRNDAGAGTPLQSPGWVTLAVIPEITGFAPGSRFRPKVSRILLKQVSDYLQQRTSGFVRVQVINPNYQEVNFSGNVKFKSGKDKQFYKSLLETDVQSFLSPWILTGSQDIVFGSTIMMSSVLQFIEQRSYVEYVTEFKMFRTGGPPEQGITADTPWSIPVAGTQNYVPLP